MFPEEGLLSVQGKGDVSSTGGRYLLKSMACEGQPAAASLESLAVCCEGLGLQTQEVLTCPCVELWTW